MNTQLPIRLLLLCAIAAAALLPGCMSSRWAMSEPAYAEKYSAPYTGDKVDKIERMAKQAIDARHVVGQAGVQANVSVADDHTAAGGELDLFFFPMTWMEIDIQLQTLAGGGSGTLLWGGGIRERIQLPTRLSPFVGVGMFVGANSVELDADNDGKDNNHNGFIDEAFELEDGKSTYRSSTKFLGAAYPEVGVHYWLTPRVRLTGSAAYYLTTEGREHDFMYYSVGVGMLIGSAPNLESDD